MNPGESSLTAPLTSKSTASLAQDSAAAPQASVVIPARNAPELLRECLSRLGQSVGCRYEVIVVDDGSTDETGTIAAEMGAFVVRLDHSLGPAAARNRGVREARGDIVVFIDADVFVKPDTLRDLVATLIDNPEYDAVIGSYDPQPLAGNLVSQYKNLLHHHTHQLAQHEASTFWSGCGAVRRQQFAELGGYDENFHRPCIEDIEFGTRLRNAGGRICLVPEIQVTHAKRWGLASWIKTDFFDRALPWTRLILQQQSMPDDLNLKVSQRLCVMSVGLLTLWYSVAWWWEPALLAVLAMSAMLVGGVDRIEDSARVSWAMRVVGLMLIPLFTCFGFLAPFSALSTLFTLLIVLCLNLRLFWFFTWHRGVLFAAMSIPLHMLYYFYCGVAFALGCTEYVYRGVQNKSAMTLKLASKASAE